MEEVVVKNFRIGEGHPLTIISGPCIIEGEEHCLRAAEFLKKLFIKNPKINFVFKSSYDKANRSSKNSFRGPGLEEGLRILQKVKEEFDLPILTDVHAPEDAKPASEVCDILQIPAFLCRQTDLVLAIAETGAVVSAKKGQFMAPWDMRNVVEKICSTGNRKILLTERGVSFGYNNLVSDMRAIPIMQKLGFPVCFDATHSTQLPGGLGETTGGQREFIPVLARAAIVSGCNCIYMESHPHPEKALSDATTVMSFEEMPRLLNQLQRLYEVVHDRNF